MFASLLVIFSINLTLKFATASIPPLHLDEAASVWFAQQDWHEFSSFLRRDASPPLYSMLLRLWTFIFGISELAVRSPSVLASSSIPVVVFAMTKQPFGKTSAWLAATMISLSPIQLDFAHQARGYALAAAFCAFSMLCFHRVMSEAAAVPSQVWLPQTSACCIATTLVAF